MANDWTRLLQEASKHGGPAAMKAYYANRGRIEGAGGVALVAAGLVLLNRARLSFLEARNADAPQPAQNEDPSPDEVTDPGEDTTPDGEASKQP